jgi:uncharacterized protein (DUF2164 family)
MALDQKVIINQIDTLVDRYENGRKQAKYPDLSDLPNQEAYELLTLMAAAVDRLAPPQSQYIEKAKSLKGAEIGTQLKVLAGILRALKTDYLAGNLQTISELIHADVFADFLEMADYLLEQGYKDPSAVIAGSVLEEHLRKLCDKNNIPVSQNQKPKKADTLNAELANASIYSKLDQKNITAWLDLRNKAAHGRYSEYAKEQVALLVQSIRDFITRHPA